MAAFFHESAAPIQDLLCIFYWLKPANNVKYVYKQREDAFSAIEAENLNNPNYELYTFWS